MNSILGDELKGIRLLPSQWEFVFSPETFACLDGGFGCGKTFAGCLKGLVLSQGIPGNRGMIFRYRATDLENTTMKVFFDEVCPPSWIKSFHRKSGTVTLHNGSQIIFRHLHDAASATKSRVAGANLGWFYLDQAEECELSHWNALIGRLRNPRAKLKQGFATANPNGHDWIWEMFFRNFKPWPKDGEKVLPLDGKYYQVFRPEKNMIGLAVNSEENRISNGGFISDDYFDNQIKMFGEEWKNRYVYCSFDVFHGKLYKEYEAGLHDPSIASVHNIEPFPIPKHWKLVTGIDVGGDSPWAVQPVYVDEEGNFIVTPGYHQRNARIADVSNWIKTNTPYNDMRTQHVIDWENRPVMIELAEHGIHCQIANKEVRSGILRVGGCFAIRKSKKLPGWYEKTQPLEQYLKFKDKGSPRIFVFKNEIKWREEHDKARWDERKPDHMWKSMTERFDTVEATRYVIQAVPEAAKIPETEDKYQDIKKLDPLTYREWTEFEKRITYKNLQFRGQYALREADMIEEPKNVFAERQYDWSVQGEF